MAAARVTLVTGGVRSGKSRHAESLLADAPAVTYVATGRPDDGSDAEWTARLAAHWARRATSPGRWTVLETLDLEGAVGSTTTPMVVDCLGTWLTGLVDAAEAWDDLTRASGVVAEALAGLLDALAAVTADVVIVTNEVGLSPVALHVSGRWFQDELGRVNAAVSAVADRVHLVVAGRVLDLSAAPVVP